ncbi:hypothetical protein [Mesorhizobium sp.]|uniref:hypothetical protein n=1 Tax=Mesorhizobium sp. TaxID=1871066 RepID=UPI000FE9977C|nr:hypothetical protein [Mesorhizobium sp.]RWP30877.1 MAG: hypothetical protein EOR03_23780 [Mesorhizobium sp.]TIL65484.1 MAG: hypothetical protein E5Y77_21550 [Mesorhizobium sp.]TIM12122.1 MAG: hypothetical protein E5Y62_02835 [Mesorhizobium sp.]
MVNETHCKRHQHSPDKLPAKSQYDHAATSSRPGFHDPLKAQGSAGPVLDNSTNPGAKCLLMVRPANNRKWRDQDRFWQLGQTV